MDQMNPPLEIKPDTGPADFAGLDQLAHQAAAIEHGATADQARADQRQADEQASTAAAELLGALQLARVIVSPAFAWWPDFARTWSDPQLQAIAQAGADVMTRQGWTMGEVMATWGPYIALAGATLPPSLVTYQAIRERRNGGQVDKETTAPGGPA